MSVLPDGSSRPGRLHRQQNYGRQRERSSSETKDCVKTLLGKSLEALLRGFIGIHLFSAVQTGKSSRPSTWPWDCRVLCLDVELIPEPVSA